MKTVIPTTWPQRIFVICLLVMVIYNAIGLSKEHAHIKEMKKLIPHQIIGHKLAGLENYTKGIPVMGYYTDAPADDEAQAKLFSYAQYLLAPTILEYNNLDHEYTLLVCSSEHVALVVMNQMHAEPYKQNKYGMILARRLP